MSVTERFIEYVMAFEKFVETDDPSVLKPFFTENAVYDATGGPPLGGRWEGREAVLANFKRALDEFDRRFDSREGDLVAGPEERDGAVWIRWAAVYTLAGAEPLRMEGEETAHFDGDRIKLLADSISDDEGERVRAYLAKHADKLRTTS